MQIAERSTLALQPVTPKVYHATLERGPPMRGETRGRSSPDPGIDEGWRLGRFRIGHDLDAALADARLYHRRLIDEAREKHDGHRQHKDRNDLPHLEPPELGSSALPRHLLPALEGSA